eukprot:CAMPEP_0181336154 /NCGR_PEP_ID=MMETSP1101-20121128/27257_1 /TAXON_ID=46948 /ORGANISM="Rhodomonas abbreviata, Strain Caron Lab Isolate" /LENGTH=34 /DNA_ID= /DNA_START= /DNA_END= /DNA_ORIENTATION=
MASSRLRRKELADGEICSEGGGVMRGGGATSYSK